MTNLEIDGVRYRVVKKRVITGVSYRVVPKRFKTQTIVTKSEPNYETIHVLEPIPYNAYKEKSDE